MRKKHRCTIFCLCALTGLFAFACAPEKRGVEPPAAKEERAALPAPGITADEEAANPPTPGIKAAEDAPKAASPALLSMEESPDLILAFYREPLLRPGVIAFFRDLTGSEDIARVILANAEARDIPPALAFALSFEESRYTLRAVNRNRNGTIDRGLFQLNSASFPKLKPADFFNVSVNARYGLSHLRWCLDSAGSDVAALAMYNAGAARVRAAGTPKNTLDYISRILRRQRKIEESFALAAPGLIPREPNETEKEERKPFRFTLLSPLGGR